MRKNKKSKNNSKEKLRMVLDNISIEDLSSEEKDYLVSLARRIEGQKIKDSAYYKKLLVGEKEEDEEIDPMKPKVTIHKRRVIKEYVTPEIKKDEPDLKKVEEPKAIEEIFEKKVEKPEEKKHEFVEPQFIEVKPKEIKKSEDEILPDQKESDSESVDRLVEWEPLDVQEEIVDEKLPEKITKDEKPESEKKIKEEIKPEEKTEIQEEKPEPEPIQELVKEEIKSEEKKLDIQDISYCIECGSKIDGDDYCFCPSCGCRLSLKDENKVDDIKKMDSEDKTEKEIPSFIPVKKIEKEPISDEWKEIEKEEIKTEEKTKKHDEKPELKPSSEKEEEELDEWEEIEKETEIQEEIKPEEKIDDKEEITEPVTEKTKQKNKEDLELEPIKDETDNSKLKEKEEIKKEDKSVESTRKIDTTAFNEIKCIDEKIVIILNNSGYYSIDDLRYVPLKELRRINGLNGKIAKKIKKEIKELDQQKTQLNNGYSEYIIEEEFNRDKEGLIEEEVTEKETEEYFENIVEESESVDVFKDMQSVDEKTSKLLLENGINSIEILREKTIVELTKIRGIRRKQAKKIKQELKDTPEEKVEDQKIIEEDKVQDEELGEWEFIDEEDFKEKDISIEGYKYKGFILYEKKITMKNGKKRTVRFFSKGEPDEGKPIDLPKGYHVKENKKTGIPFLKKK